MKKLKLGKRSYFHISKSYLGDQHVFTPKVPETSIIKIEGDIPRICVSPSMCTMGDKVHGKLAMVIAFQR